MIDEKRACSTRILLIEDSNTDAVLIQAHLKKADSSFQVTRRDHLAAGLDYLIRGDVDVVLLDLNLPDSAGLETFKSVHQNAPQVPIVVLSGQDDAQVANDAVSLGAQDYLPKGEANRSTLARSIRYAIERSRRMRVEQELTTAGEIQRRLFPQRPPQLAGFDIHGRCEPANSAGGDYFDFFPMLNNSTGIVIADVAGHGIGPALIMSGTRAILRTLASTGNDVGEILTRANQVLSHDLHDSVFVALLLISLDARQQVVRFASAGHPALLLNSDGHVKGQLVSDDPPLGIIDDRQFMTSKAIQMDSGDTILLYTDGIVEAFDGSEQPFGEHRLIETVSACIHEDSGKMINTIFDCVRDFAGDEPQRDDMTAVVIKAD